MYENGIVNYIYVLDAQRIDANAFSVRTDKDNSKENYSLIYSEIVYFPLAIVLE